MIASGKPFAAAVVLGCSLVARAAEASPPPSDAEQATARALYRDALGLERQGRFDEAAARLEAAYRTVKTPVLGLELGKLDAQLGRIAAAYDVLRAVDDIPTGPHETDKGREARREAATLAASLRERLAMLRIATPSDVGEVAARVDGATIDDAESVIVDAGPHVVTLIAGGRECASASVTVQEGELRAVDFRDRAAACAPPSAKAPAARDVTPPLQPLAKIASPEPSESLSTQRWLALGLVGAGGVSVAVGAVVALRAKSDYDSVAADCVGSSCIPVAFSVRESARSRATGATYAIGLGLAAATAGVTLWLTDSKSSAAKRVGVAVSTSGVSLSIVTQ